MVLRGVKGVTRGPVEVLVAGADWPESDEPKCAVRELAGGWVSIGAAKRYMRYTAVLPKDFSLSKGYKKVTKGYQGGRNVTTGPRRPVGRLWLLVCSVGAAGRLGGNVMQTALQKASFAICDTRLGGCTLQDDDDVEVARPTA
jgi:hypothetical protein